MVAIDLRVSKSTFLIFSKKMCSTSVALIASASDSMSRSRSAASAPAPPLLEPAAASSP